MSSIITSVFKATIGLLVDKARSHAAKELKDGDVMDQTFRNLVVQDIDDIKSKLDGLAMRELSASLDIFKTGIVCLNQVFEKEIERMEKENEERGTIVGGNCVTRGFGRLGQISENIFGKKTDEKKASGRRKNDNVKDVSCSSCQQLAKPSVEAESLITKGLQHVQLADLSESARLSFEDAKKRFDEARVEATRAFRNEVLSTSDRILAMEILLMSTILGRVDRPADAVVECRLCLQNLHAVPAVRENFKVQLAEGVKSMFNRHEREVCRVNHAIFAVTQIINGSSESDDRVDPVCRPGIEIGNASIDVLRDKRVMKILLQLDMAHCCHGEWTFGQEGERAHNLKQPEDICTNSQGQFIVVDRHKVKVFSSSGKFVRSLCPLTSDDKNDLEFVPNALATDLKDHVYVLATLWNKQTRLEPWRGVYVYDNHFDVHHKFPLKGRLRGDAMAVNKDNQIFVVGNNSVQGLSRQVHVYEADGHYVRSFSEHKHNYQSFDCIATNDGRFMILDLYAQLVHVFNAQGDKMLEFSVQGERNTSSISFNHSKKDVIVASWNSDSDRGQVVLYTEDGEFVRRIQLNSEKRSTFHGVTVTVDGRIAVTSYHEGKVYVCK